jgi:hypothetical protein
MDKQIIRDIAADAAELGRALREEGIHVAELQAEIVAGAMPGFITYETTVTRRGSDPQIPGAAVPGER